MAAITVRSVAKLIKYETFQTSNKNIGLLTATLFFAGQRFRGEMILPKNAGVDCEMQIRQCLEGMVLAGLSAWVDTGMEDDTLEAGHQADVAKSQPLSKPSKSERVSRPLESEPIGIPPKSEPFDQLPQKGN